MLFSAKSIVNSTPHFEYHGVGKLYIDASENEEILVNLLILLTFISLAYNLPKCDGIHTLSFSQK